MNTYSQKITSLQSNAIKDLFISLNAVFDVVQYSFWRAKTNTFQAIYYTSGKLLIQGKNIENVAIEVDKIIGVKSCFEQSNLIDFNQEKYIGTDESGKGDFFGPLVVAGVQVDKNNKQKFIELGIKDSKKLDDKKILMLANQIKANSVHSVVVITPVKYNELYAKFSNLNKLLAWGHARAIENILEKSPCNYALADKFGDESLIKNALMQKGRSIVLNQMVRAESDIAVAAASVLARAEFVKRMQELELKYELQLSKGVSEKVIQQAKNFISKYSFDSLNEIAKMHFKTVNELR
ncbi:TPA: ribonuclease HIII [Candidatus Avigastranaerophilus faecigallinarum]|nr:ribonuclease HIII [Candidatus Avigastranaerophilus faecigallinarum]